MIKLEILSDYNRINEYAAVCWLAMGENPGPVTDEFIREITRYVDNARSNNPVINHENGLAFALWDDDKIIGTLCVNEDRHFSKCAQFNHFAIVPSARGHMYGRYLLNVIRQLISKYCDFKYGIGSTVTAGPFYQALKIPKIGEITADGYTRYFYGAAL